jgi:3',5'-nucleoside bisphosphate phosphatase
MTDFVATDLHGHSYLSDGRISPEQYVGVRAEHGLEVIALADHDTFAGVDRAAAAAAEAGLTLVPAMEVTATIHFGTERAEQIHVLAYHAPSALTGGALARSALAARAARLHRAWRAFVLAWLDALEEHDRRMIDPSGELAACSAEAFPALQSFLNLVLASHPRLYEAFLRRHVRFWDDAELFSWTPEEAIDAIRGDGALDIVAHPVRVRDKARMDAVLAYASGHEAYTSRHRATIAERFRALAEQTGKHWTASSDDHQHTGYAPPPSGTPRRTVERILAGA